jgi:hypothetical protein
MRKHNSENERTKRGYFIYLKEARRLSEHSIDAAAAALSRFEDGAAGRAAVVVGVTALLAALGLSTGDRFVGRRARRRIP